MPCLFGQLKIAATVEDIAEGVLERGGGDRARREAVRRAIWDAIRGSGLTDPDAITARGARDDVVRFLVEYDLAFRTRRLRFVARRLTQMAETMEAERGHAESVLRTIHALIADYRERENRPADEATLEAFAQAEAEPATALAAYGRLLELAPLDAATDKTLGEAFALLPKADRRTLILAYLGYPYYDVATLPLLQGEGLDEFDPIKVDRLSPNDATAISAGGPQATLKACIQQLRRLRQRDYRRTTICGAACTAPTGWSTRRLHPRRNPPAPELYALKRDAFRSISPRTAALKGSSPCSTPIAISGDVRLDGRHFLEGG